MYKLWSNSLERWSKRTIRRQFSTERTAAGSWPQGTVDKFILRKARSAGKCVNTDVWTSGGQSAPPTRGRARNAGRWRNVRRGQEQDCCRWVNGRRRTKAAGQRSVTLRAPRSAHGTPHALEQSDANCILLPLTASRTTTRCKDVPDERKGSMDLNETRSETLEAFSLFQQNSCHRCLDIVL